MQNTNWLSQPVGGTIEVEITFKCNLKCRHCNRFCNSEKEYNIVRNISEMRIEHITFLCSELIRLPKLKFDTLRIIGGEPLMSDILNDALFTFKDLVTKGYIRNIEIVTNGTFSVKDDLKAFVKLLPEKLNTIFHTKGYLSKQEVYQIKEIKHRNITVVPADYDLQGKLCNRVLLCGINYSIYGFSLCAPCLTPMILFPENHYRFLHEIPLYYGSFISENFENEVCSKCSFCNSISENFIIRNNSNFIGKTWQNQINSNKNNYVEPDIDWILTKS
jgi:hypothetical protein